MKRSILLISILFTGLITFSQVVRETSPTSIVNLIQRGMFGRNLYVPKVTSIPVLSPSLSTGGGVDTAGAIVYCSFDSSLYVWSRYGWKKNGITDTSGLAHKLYNLAENITGNKTFTDTSFLNLTLPLVDSSKKLVNTDWVKRALFLQRSGTLFPQYSVPVADASGKLAATSDFTWDGNSFNIGYAGFYSQNTINIHGGNGIISAGGFGMYFNAQGGYPADPSKSYTFYNGSYLYHKLTSTGTMPGGYHSADWYVQYFRVRGLSADSVAPTITGTNHMLTVDANGLFSHQTILDTIWQYSNPSNSGGVTSLRMNGSRVSDNLLMGGSQVQYGLTYNNGIDLQDAGLCCNYDIMRNGNQIGLEKRAGLPNIKDTIFLRVGASNPGANTWRLDFSSTTGQFFKPGTRAILYDNYLNTYTNISTSLFSITATSYTFTTDGNAASWGTRFAIYLSPGAPPATTTFYTNNILNLQSEMLLNGVSGLSGQVPTAQGIGLPLIWGTPAGGGGGTWGGITGTLSSQTDLTAALNGKEASLGNPGTTGFVLSSTTGGVRSWIAPGGASQWTNIADGIYYSSGDAKLTNGAFKIIKGSDSTSLELNADELNASVKAAYLTISNGNRIFLGKAGAGVYALNLSHVSTIENMPAFMSSDGTYIGGSSASSPYLRRNSNDVILGTHTSGGIYFYQNPSNFLGGFFNGGVLSVNNVSPNVSAQLDVASTTKGALLPRMTTAQQNAIATPATGLQIFNTDLVSFMFYNGTAWVAVGGGGGISVIKQTHTSGITVTVSNTTTWLIVNPATILASLAVTLPASPTDGQDVLISFGGTITSGGVVTAISISPTPIDATTPNFVAAGEHIAYRWNATNSKWYRIN